MIHLCITGVALFFTLFFYVVMKFQHIEKTHTQQLDA
jgi:hypothetical protein